MGILDDLDRVVIDWCDFDTAAEATRELVTRLAGDKLALRELIYGIEDSPKLRFMAETHDNSSKLVLFDALDRGFRVRLHLYSADNVRLGPRLIHNHLFSFSATVLHSEYLHQMYDLPEPLPRGPLDGSIAENFRSYFVTRQEVRSSYSLHHTAFHDVAAADDTVSVFIRGPKEDKARVMVVEHEGRSWTCDGTSDLAPAFQPFHTMSDRELRGVRDHLGALLGLGAPGRRIRPGHGQEASAAAHSA